MIHPLRPARRSPSLQRSLSTHPSSHSILSSAASWLKRWMVFQAADDAAIAFVRRATQAWSLVQKMQQDSLDYFKPRVALIENLDHSASIFEFALERTMEYTDEMHELEALFDSLPPLLESLDANITAGPDRRRTILYAPKISEALSRYFDACMRPHSPSEAIAFRRVTVGMVVIRRLLVQLENMELDFRRSTGEFHVWRSLHSALRDISSNPTPNAKLLAAFHLHVLRAIVYRRAQHTPHWQRALKMHVALRAPYRLLHVHSESCCKTKRAADATTFHRSISHYAVNNAITFLDEIFRAPLDSIEALANEWQACLTQMRLDDLNPVSHATQSEDFKNFVANLGLNVWLEPGSEFLSDPVGGQPECTEKLQKYPQLLLAMRHIVRAIISPFSPASRDSTPSISTEDESSSAPRRRWRIRPRRSHDAYESDAAASVSFMYSSADEGPSHRQSMTTAGDRRIRSPPQTPSLLYSMYEAQELSRESFLDIDLSSVVTALVVVRRAMRRRHEDRKRQSAVEEPTAPQDPV